MLFRFSIILILGLLLNSFTGIDSSQVLAVNTYYNEITDDVSKNEAFEPEVIIKILSNPQDAKQEEDTAKSSNPKAEEKKEKGFIKKLFSSASKEEKAAKKEAKSLKKIEKKQTRIYGWHPYWMNDSHAGYQYNLLTTLSYYSIDASYNKKYKSVNYNDHNINGAKVRNLFNRASRAGCRIDVTFKCQDREAIYLLLNNETIRDSCIRYIVQKLNNNYKYDGVCIVFENIPSGNSASLLLFMATLREALEESKQTLKLALPAKDFANNFDIIKLNLVVDEYVMMGYNYYHKGSKAGPVAPLDDSPRKFHLKASVQEYLKNGVPYNKFIVALPYFGIVWKKHGSDMDEYSFHKHWSYSQIKKHMASSDAHVKYNSVTSTYYYDFNDSIDSTISYRCYFDNAESLAKKYKWVIKQGLAGVGIWALGYDHGSEDFWKMIDKNFKVIKLPPISKKIDILNRNVKERVDTLRKNNDSTYVLYSSTIIKDTIIIDTLLKGLIHGPMDTAVRPEEPSMLSIAYERITDYFDPLLQNQTILAIIAMTLIAFGLIGMVSSLLFNSVRELIYIRSFPTYIFVHIVLIVLVLAVFGFLHLLKTDLCEIYPIYYGHFIKGTWILLIIGFLTINLLSYRLIGSLSFNYDKP